MMESNTNQELLGAQEQVEKTKELIKNNDNVPGMEDVVEFAKTKLLGLEEKVKSILKTSESQFSQVEEQGGNKEEVVERTQGVDKNIEEVKVETAEKIKEVKSNGVEGNEENEIKNEKYKNLPENVRKYLLRAEHHINHEQQQINEMKQVLESYNKIDNKGLSKNEIYGNTIKMVDSIADIVGDGNYGFGLDILRNPETYHNVLAEGQLNNTEVSMSYPEKKYEYPPDAIDLREKSKRLDSEFRKLMIEAKKIRQDAKSLLGAGNF